MSVEGRSGFTALSRSSNFVGTGWATDGFTSGMAGSTTNSFSSSSYFVRGTSFGARGITSFSDPVVVLTRWACGAFGSIVDLTSSGTGALTVFTSQVGFTAYAIGVFLAGFGAFRFTFGVVGVGSFGGVVTLTFTVHLE